MADIFSFWFTLHGWSRRRGFHLDDRLMRSEANSPRSEVDDPGKICNM